VNNKKVQEIARDTIEYLKTQIVPRITVKQIVELAETYMMAKGITSFWYYDIGAFVFAGEDTVRSVSGRNYTPSNREIEENDIITIDLSPQYECVWGDYARTIIIENRQIKEDVACIENQDFKDGILSEEKLHKQLIKIAEPDMTFSELYYLMNDFVAHLGYINLDLHGNLGHSIEKNKDNRIYIEAENNARLSEVAYFTFEPHIGKADSSYGFKMENIYCFNNSQLTDVLNAENM